MILQGAENLGWSIDELMEKTLEAMRSCEASISEQMDAL